jgi:hypothetical protein
MKKRVKKGAEWPLDKNETVAIQPFGMLGVGDEWFLKRT